MNSVWITDANEGKIQHLELREDIKIIQTRKIPDSEIPEMRCFSKNGILLASLTKILRFTADGNFKTFKDFSPSKVLTLHVTITGDIVVGMNFNQTDNKTKQKRPVIVILGNDGKTKSEYMDSCGQLLKNDIVRCCTVLDGDVICYIDSAIGLPCNGRLVVLNKSGYIQWTYNGNSTIITENHPFTPMEVISTKNNNIITSHIDQNAIHILTSTGSLLTVLDLSLFGIKTPGAMALVNSQFLWMTGKDNDDNKTLFKLEISGV